jgi:malate/lactate dehydrogenase
MHGTDRVVIVGTGLVGAITAYALLQTATVPEIVLIDRDPIRAEGHVHDLRDAALFTSRRHSSSMSRGPDDRRMPLEFDLRLQILAIA